MDGRREFRRLTHLVATCLLLLAALPCLAAESARAVIAKAVVMDEGKERADAIAALSGQSDADIPPLLTAWKEGGIFIYQPTDKDGNAVGDKVAVTFSGEKDDDDARAALRLDTGAPLMDAGGNPVRLAPVDVDSADTDSDLRIAMKNVLDLFAIANPDPAERLRAVEQVGLAQDPDKLPALKSRIAVETDSKVRGALGTAIAMAELRSDNADTQVAAIQHLGSTGVIAARDALKTLARETEQTRPAVFMAAKAALGQIETHIKWVNFWGTIFRGLSLGSVLLVVAIGLAITFGLMGVINMAHGELIAVGAYTAYVVQCVFAAGLKLSPFGKFTIAIPGMNAGAGLFQWYFVLAIPLSFLTAAIAGVILERTVIQWLYRRPLESLLATWGVSLVLQQLFRSIFGSNNVQVDSPAWLSGNWTMFDVIFGWNRVFVICFAIAIIAGTWLILNKTPLGLLIRAVMQNRSMAACMGVRTERVNMLTFAFGSGLAGLAGAFLSQLGNVGPGMGQDRIVDAFMTVVVGGVGSIFGTVISAIGIGVADQSLQQLTGNPVLGKILVLGAIILFLQWKPAGLFITKSRSLES
jgi:urea transport system permease protein